MNVIDIHLERIEGEITDVEYEEITGQIVALTQQLGINGLISVEKCIRKEGEKMNKLKEWEDKRKNCLLRIEKANREEKEWREQEQNFTQELIDIDTEIKKIDTRIPYCPSCGKPCTRNIGILHICDNFDCIDYLTQWEWHSDYHGGLRRH